MKKLEKVFLFLFSVMFVFTGCPQKMDVDLGEANNITLTGSLAIEGAVPSGLLSVQNLISSANRVAVSSGILVDGNEFKLVATNKADEDVREAKFTGNEFTITLVEKAIYEFSLYVNNVEKNIIYQLPKFNVKIGDEFFDNNEIDLSNVSADSTLTIFFAPNAALPGDNGSVNLEVKSELTKQLKWTYIISDLRNGKKELEFENGVAKIEETLEHGFHFLYIEITDESDDVVFSTMQGVNVFSGFVTDKWLPNGSKIFRTTGETCELVVTDDLLKEIVQDIPTVEYTKYTVEHWYETLDSTEVYEAKASETEEKSGKIGNSTGATAKTVEGFTAKEVTQETIAATGTVVKIYYDRNTITLTFDFGDGKFGNNSGETELKGKYGASLAVNPTRDGYTFDGWQDENSQDVVLPETFEKDAKYTAKWKEIPPSEAKYTVKHCYEKPDSSNGQKEYEEKSSETEEKTGKIGDSTEATAKTVEGFTAKSVTQAEITADGSTVISIYYDRKTVTFTFDFDNGTSQQTVSGLYGAAVTVPTPTKTGYTFAGWKNGDADATVPSTFPASDATYTAKWTPQPNGAIAIDSYNTYDIALFTSGDKELTKNNSGAYKVAPMQKIKVSLVDPSSREEVGNISDWVEESSITLYQNGEEIDSVSAPQQGGSTNPIAELLVSHDLVSSGYSVRITAIISGVAYDQLFPIEITGDALISAADVITYIGENNDNGLCGKITLNVTGDESTMKGGNYDSSPLGEALKKLTNAEIALTLSEMETIPEYAFYDCKNITSVTIGDDTTAIEEYAFSSCENIKSVTFGDSVANIGEWAFYWCNGITEVHVPSIENWLAISFESDNANPLAGSSEKKLYAGNEIVKDLVVPDGVTSINDYAFYDYGLTSVTIPDRVTKIGKEAFYLLL